MVAKYFFIIKKINYEYIPRLRLTNGEEKTEGGMTFVSDLTDLPNRFCAHKAFVTLVTTRANILCGAISELSGK